MFKTQKNISFEQNDVNQNSPLPVTVSMENSSKLSSFPLLSNAPVMGKIPVDTFICKLVTCIQKAVGFKN